MRVSFFIANSSRRCLSGEYFANHSQDGLLPRDLGNFIKRDPSQGFRLGGNGQFGVSVRLEQESNIVMEVRWGFGGCGNLMNINVEDVSGDGTHAVQAGFLARLPPRHIEHIGIVFDVPAELRSYSEFGVMREQGVRMIPIDYPGRAGQVAVSYTHLTLPTIYSV